MENAWRYYIASYTSIDDTIAVDRTNIQPVILLRNLHAMGADPKADNFPLSFDSATLASATEAATATSDQDHGDGTVATSVDYPTANASSDAAVGNKLLNRFLANKNQETLNLRIAVNNYHPQFVKNTQEAFFMRGEEREGGEKEVRASEETEGERQGLVRERFLLMNEGMKGLSREEVEGRNAEFGRLTGDREGGATAGGGAEEDGDVVMVE